MRVYLDNNATTAIHPAVLNALEAALRDVYGNASSIHNEGQSARRAIEQARESIAALAGASAREIVFTSGGTESNNAAIFGAAGGGNRHHIVTTAIEHPSVLEPIAELERRGHQVTRVAPSRSGVVAAADVIAAMRPETRLVAMMLANNETGVVQPVAEVGRACRERGVHLHCDAVQAMGKIDVDVAQLAVDSLAMSAHKLHGPKGIGALYVRNGVVLDRHLFGGAQERRRRAGTENVPLAVAFGVATDLARDAGIRTRVAELRDRLEAELIVSSSGSSGSSVPRAVAEELRGTPRNPEELHVVINGGNERRVPNTSSVTFSGADAEGIVIGLDLGGVAVSTGAACSSGRVEPSHVLLAMGLTPEEARSTIRFSLSRFTTDAEIAETLRLTREIVPRARPVAR
jgi:cysteine desulfurase